MNKNNRGITLIALVVTIIVLLILAGSTISLVVGQNGIITRANQAKLKNENGTVFEYLAQVILAEQIEQRGENFDVSTYLQINGYMNENSVLNVEKTVGKKLNYGNGTTKDIYIVKSDGLYYVDEKGNENLIGNIEMGEKIATTPDDYFDFDPATGTITLKDLELYYSDFNGSLADFPIDTIVIPSQINGGTVKKIGQNGMAAKNLKSVILPNTLIEIGNGAFWGCKELTSMIIPDSVITMGNEAFKNCRKLEEITLSQSLNNIKYNTFYNCTSLKSMVIPNSVTSIKDEAFSKCTGIKEIVIPESVKNIDGWSFSRMDQ